MRNVLVTGGAGYIGSHMVKLLRNNGFHPIVLDDLSNGHVDAVKDSIFVQGNIGDPALVNELCQKYNFEGAINFAASILVGDVNTDAYYKNNVENTTSLINVLKNYPIKYFIFSSTAAVFGEPKAALINEDHAKKPTSVYGKTKLLAEEMLNNSAASSDLKIGILRYFNAAGADESGELGERHEPETHLIPILLQVASGKRKQLEIYGDDYPTHDGSSIRDYVHVTDICQAHLQLLEYIISNNKSEEFNLGTGKGHSVKEVIAVVEKVTGKTIPVVISQRREGDVSKLVADGSKARHMLGWQPEHSSLEKIITDAWRWEKANA